MISEKALDLIKKYEGFSPLEYICAAGRRTIGYGHCLEAGEEYPAGISEKFAEELLAKDLKSAEKAVDYAVKVPLSAVQREALVSFAFNVGAGNFKRSLLLRLLNEGGYDEVPDQLMRWIYANGSICAGLMRRRKAEAELFASEDKKRRRK